MLNKPVSRRSALAAFASITGTLAVVGLGGCASDSPSQPAESPEAQEPQPPQDTAQTARDELAWWQDAVVYEAYPKSFLDTAGKGTGTLAGLTEKLDYLADLGVRAIWLTPIYVSPQKDNGYDVADYYDIDPRYGTMDDMDKLILEASQRGILIVMDLVMNHTSNESEWFKQSSSSKDNPKADWYIWRDAKKDGSAPTNWRGIFGGSAWTWSESRKQYYLHTFADFQPDLNWECEAMRQELYNMARFWLNKGAGGFRIDAVTYIKKPKLEDGPVDGPDGLSSIHAVTANTPGILDFLGEFKREVMQGHDAFTVAEANGVDASELGSWVGKNGAFDMLFEFSHILVPQGGNEIWYEPAEWKLTDLKRALTTSQEATATNGWYPIYFENHDQARSISQFLPDANDKVAAGKLLGTVLMTLRGTPFLYEGEELGYTNVAWKSIDDYDDVSSHNQYKQALAAGKTEEEALAAVHAHSRDNARTPMQWDASKNAGFSSGKPWLPVHDDYKTCNVEKQLADANSVLMWYKLLAKLREEQPLLVAGDYAELMADSEEVYAYERTHNGERLVVLANFVEREVPYDEALVEGMSVALDTHGSSAPGVLQPYQAIVFVAS